MSARSLARRLLPRSGASGAVLRGLERGESARLVLASGAFDRAWYEGQAGRRFPGTAAAVAHYLGPGRRAGASPHPLFEPAWFDRQQPVRSGADPFAVFLGSRPGTRDGRSVTPHPLFDPAVWAARHPECLDHAGGPLGHFAATAGPATLLPVPGQDEAHAAGWTWGPARDRLERARLGRASRDAPDGRAGPGPAPRVTVVVGAGGDWEHAWRCVGRVLAADSTGGLRVLAAGGGSGGGTGALLAALAGTDVRVRHVPCVGGPARCLATAQALVEGPVAVLLDRAARVDDGWLAPLVEPLDDPRLLGVSGLLLAPDGTLRSAGATFPARGTLPAHLLAGHPPEDARRLGERVEVTAVAAGALALRTADLRACGGPDVEAGPGLELADLCLRLASGRPGCFLVRTSVSIRTESSPSPGSPPPEEPGVDVRAARLRFRRAWADVPRSDSDAVRPAGFDVAHYVPAAERGVPADVRSPVPVLVRTASGRGGGTGASALRWAVRTAVPSGERARLWGDLHFAAALAAALERAGQQVAVDHREAAERASSALDDVVLVVRGRTRVAPRPGAVNLLWVISHPELVTDEELEGFDAVFAASESWAARATARSGVEVTPLLQATDAGRFRPEGAVPDSGDPVLFVGNSRNVYRPVVRHLVEAGEDVAVYGGRWERFLPAGYVRGDHVPNAELPARYRAAGVVLNDHWDHMRDEGFLSNRLFDAAATGARVLTDDVAGAEALFGGLVRVWRDEAGLRRLVRDRRAAFPGSAERDRLARLVLERHSFDARARVLRRAAADLWERRAPQGVAGRRHTAREETS